MSLFLEHHYHRALIVSSCIASNIHASSTSWWCRWTEPAEMHTQVFCFKIPPILLSLISYWCCFCFVLFILYHIHFYTNELLLFNAYEYFPHSIESFRRKINWKIKGKINLNESNCLFCLTNAKQCKGKTKRKINCKFRSPLRIILLFPICTIQTRRNLNLLNERQQQKNVLRNMQPEEDTHADWPDSNRNHKSKSLHSPNFCAVRFAALCDAVFTNLYGCLGVRQSVPPKKSSYILRTWKKCEVKAMEKSRIAKLTHDTHNFKPSQVSDSSVNAWICIAFIFFASFVATVCYSYARSHKANMLYIFIYKLQYQ